MNSSNDLISRKRKFLGSRREEIIEKQYYEIKALETKYQRLYDNSPVMCRTINSDGIILDCNQAYLDNLRYSYKSEVVGHSIFEHTPEDKIHLKRESFEQWRTTGSVRSKEVWLLRKDGSEFPALINASNLYDEAGKLVGSNTVITDLTENYKARIEIEKAYEMRQDFVRIAAHELRTPIQPILMCAEAAKRGLVDQEEAWNIIIADAKRLKKLADDILDVSRIESGKLPYDFQKVSINEMIKEVVTSAQSFEWHQSQLMGSKGVAIEASLGEDLQTLLDKTRMIQALSNIVNNSLKFTKEGQIKIETRILSHKKLFEIKISDTGSGISQEILPRLFEKFVTEASVDTSNKHGTGLGLFITKSIIQAHGGDIFAYNNNEDGNGMRGATFVMRLPIRNNAVN
jgi:PAS domain S-box-containing protein